MTLNRNYILPSVILLLVLAAFSSAVAGQERQTEHNQELYQELLPDPDQSYDPQTAQGVNPEQGYELQSRDTDPGWFFDSFFLGVEFMNNLATLHMSRIQEGEPGTIWAAGGGETHSGTFIGLLFRYQEGEWETVLTFDLISEKIVTNVPMYATQNGPVWYSNGYQLYRYENGVSNIYTPDSPDLPEPDDDDQEWIMDMTVASNGDVWYLLNYPRLVSFDGNSEWAVYDSSNSIMPAPTPGDATAANLPNNLLAWAGGNLWISTLQPDGGLIRKMRTNWEHFTTENSELPGDYVTSIVAQTMDSVWVGTMPTEAHPESGGLANINRKLFEDVYEWEVYTTDNGLPDNSVRVHATEDGGYLWASFGAASDPETQPHTGFLAEFDGNNWTTIAGKDEFYSFLGWMTIDENNNKWLAGDFNVINGGVGRLNENAITFTNVPDEGQYYYTGDTFSVQWDAGRKIDKVDLWYSLNGSSWNPVEEGLKADTFHYQYTFPDKINQQIQLRIRDAHNTSVRDTSGFFKVLNLDAIRYHLRQSQPDGGYKLFDPLVHGWSIRNQERYMWLEEDWEDITYPSALQLPPLSAVPEDFPSWDHLVQAFGEDEVTTTWPLLGTMPKTAAITMWRILKRNGFMGVCHGFAVTSLLAFSDGIEGLEPIGIHSDEDTLYNIEADPDVRNAINVTWTKQFGKYHLVGQLINSVSGGLLKGPTETLEEVKHMLERTSSSDYHQHLILIPPDSVSIAHTILAYRAEESSVYPDVWDIYVHDSNQPWNDTLKVQVNTASDYWWYATPARIDGQTVPVINYSGYGGLFLGDRVDAYLTQSKFLKEVHDDRKQPHSPAEQMADHGYMYSLFSADTEIRFQDNTGNESSYEALAVSSGIPGSLPITPAVGGEHPPIGYLLPDNEYLIDLEFMSGNDIFAAVNEATIYQYSAADTTALGITDRLRYGNSVTVLGNDDGSPRSFNMAIMQDYETEDQMYHIMGASVAENDSVRFSLSDESELVLENYGSPSTIDIELKEAFGNERAYFLYEGFELSGSTAYKLQADWNDVAQNDLIILIDSNMNGSYSESVVLQNVSTSTEPSNPADVPDYYALAQNYPNPFNPSTTIRFSLPSGGNVHLAVYDVLGRNVATLVDESMSAGYHEITFDAGRLASGIYLYQLRAGSFVDTKQLTLIK